LKKKIVVLTVALVLAFILVFFTISQYAPTIINKPPIADAGSDQTVWIGEVVYFDGSGSKDPDGEIVEYTWDFGDGIKATGIKTTYTYKKPADITITQYTVTLKVTDNAGAVSTATCVVKIKFVELRLSIRQGTGYWNRDTSTDLPAYVTMIEGVVENLGTGEAENVKILKRKDGALFTISSTFFVPPKGSTDLHLYDTKVTVPYDTTDSFFMKASSPRHDSAEVSLTVKASFPRSTPYPIPLSSRDVTRLYITPNDQFVRGILNKILNQHPLVLEIAIRDWVANNIRYEYDSKVYGGEYWQLPRETLSRGTGDCEDYAILLCSLYRAMGYSANDVYVVLGLKENTGHGWVKIRVKILGYPVGWWNIEPQVGVGFKTFYADFQWLGGFQAKYNFNDISFMEV